MDTIHPTPAARVWVGVLPVGSSTFLSRMQMVTRRGSIGRGEAAR